mmetsp:Transcript_48591/g.49369  ORF Transcript_48591/g.49369 Transcript_48591/m.49369 type:complete len:124 (+) Transcript_48591:1178-1549(+)
MLFATGSFSQIALIASSTGNPVILGLCVSPSIISIDILRFTQNFSLGPSKVSVNKPSTFVLLSSSPILHAPSTHNGRTDLVVCFATDSSSQNALAAPSIVTTSSSAYDEKPFNHLSCSHLDHV